jgi:Cu+-exporting ATPase
MALSSLSVVTNANRLRRYRAAPLPAAPTTPVEPKVETITELATHTATADRAKANHTHHSGHGTAEASVVDPVCGMTITPPTATSRSTDAGTSYFCSEHCAGAFDKEPQSYGATVDAKP